MAHVCPRNTWESSHDGRVGYLKMIHADGRMALRNHCVHSDLAFVFKYTLASQNG
jgi:hypothetical protein